MNGENMIKKVLLEGFGGRTLDIATIAVCLMVTVLIAAYIFVVYRIVNRNSFYNRNFNLSLIALAVITAAIILTIQSNIVISLGMVGALSIVRFRTAIKDPMDLVFLLWAISVGIICGAGFAIIAVIASFVTTIVIILFEMFSVGKAPVILLVNATDYKSEKVIEDIINNHCTMYKVKARNLTKQKLDMAIEVHTNMGIGLLEELMAVESVVSASLLDHDGEVTF
ncbi:MAG: DUF4956 domain-containing protein [Lachnospiraceae bacterium]|nr:DUF4956 domain-containing protein [Lachnospiraceae bacterium]